jgi:hypothetical protein
MQPLILTAARCEMQRAPARVSISTNNDSQLHVVKVQQSDGWTENADSGEPAEREGSNGTDYFIPT